MKLHHLLIAAALASSPVISQAAGDIEAGKAKAMTCVACHGANGKSPIPTYPNLAGQNAMYLEMALKDYKNGKRTGPQSGIMAGMAKPLSDTDIANLAAYFSSL